MNKVDEYNTKGCVLQAVYRQKCCEESIVTTIQFYMTDIEHLGIETVYEEANCCLLKV